VKYRLLGRTGVWVSEISQALIYIITVSRSPVAYPNWIQDWFAPTRTPAGNLA
jgi:hypothetical protein